MTNTPEEMPYKIALLIDGKVEQIYYANQADAAKLLSQPTFQEIPENEEVLTGYTFDGTNFIAPVAP